MEEIEKVIPSNGMSDEELPDLPPFSWAKHKYPLPTPPENAHLKDNQTVYSNQNYVQNLAIAYRGRYQYLTVYFYWLLAMLASLIVFGGFLIWKLLLS